MKSILYTADIHLDANPRNDYRWDIFQWLTKTVEQRNVGAIVIAGDLTDGKDNHGAELVNRVADELAMLAAKVPVWFMTGNHDYVDPKTPFFKFLRSLPGLTFMWQPTTMDVLGRKHLFLPHTRQWKEWRYVDMKTPDRVVFHYPLRGAKTSTGQQVDGARPASFLRSPHEVVAGDIHRPQRIGNVLYCGSPHPVHFGEDHDPRVLLDTGEKRLVSVARLTVRKRIITLYDPQAVLTMDANEGDFVKITMILPRSEFHRWKEVKKIIRKGCKKRHVILCGINIQEAVRDKRRTVNPRVPGRLAVAKPLDVFKQYCSGHDIDGELMEAGTHFLEGKPQ